MDSSVLPWAMFAVTALGWSSREVWRIIEARKQKDKEKIERLYKDSNYLEHKIIMEQNPAKREKYISLLNEVDDTLTNITTKTLQSFRIK